MTIVESESETEKNPLEHVHFVALSDVGMRRGENQDSWGIIETDHFKFYIVADGMGGVKGGAVASQLAVDVIKAFVSERTEIVKGDIVGSVGAANYAIFQRGLEEPSLSGMGTTLVGLCFVGNRLLCVNVGDSRAYLVRDQKVTQLTEDHTLIHELLRSGAISEDQVENHPVAHMLTRSLGPTADIQIDCFSVVQAPVAGDRYLLCSDGLYNHLSVEDILRICVQNSIDQAKKELVDLANERGGSDNITVLLIEVGEGFPANIEDTIDFEEDGLTYSQDSKQDEVSEAQDTLDNIHIDDELKNGVPAKSFEEKSVVEMNGAGAEEIVSPEIKQNVDTQLHGRYREEILEKVVAEEEEHLENANKAIQVKSKALRYLSVIVCVAVGTSAYLYWNTSNRFKRRNSAQIAAIAKEIDSAPIDNTLVTAPIEEIPSSVTDPKENLLNTSKEPEEKPAEDSQSIAKEETLDLDSDSSTKLVDDQNQGNQNTETSLSKIDQIRLELERLDQQADRLEQQLASFDQPLSGSTAELLALSSKAVDQISKKMQAIDAQIEENKKQLAIWYGQKQRIKSTEILKLANEIAPRSKEVAEQKKKFENITWQYLKEREALDYDPKNEALIAKIGDLVELRKKELKQLNIILNEAISREMQILDDTIGQLAINNERLSSGLDLAKKDLSYVHALMSQDSGQRAAMQSKLKEQLAKIESQKDSLEKLLESLFNESIVLDDHKLEPVK